MEARESSPNSSAPKILSQLPAVQNEHKKGSLYLGSKPPPHVLVFSLLARFEQFWLILGRKPTFRNGLRVRAEVRYGEERVCNFIKMLIRATAVTMQLFGKGFLHIYCGRKL